MVIMTMEGADASHDERNTTEQGSNNIGEEPVTNSSKEAVMSSQTPNGREGSGSTNVSYASVIHSRGVARPELANGSTEDDSRT